MYYEIEPITNGVLVHSISELVVSITFRSVGNKIIKLFNLMILNHRYKVRQHGQLQALAGIRKLHGHHAVSQEP